MSPRRIRPRYVIALFAGAIAVGGGWAAWRGAARGASTSVTSTKSREPGPRPVDPSTVLDRVERDGIRVECRLAPVGVPGLLREGQDVRIEFRLSDTAGGAPLAKAYPTAWGILHPEGTPPTTVRDSLRHAQALANGGLFHRPEIDLNVYYVLTLNDDPTITVVDPRFGFGGTKLLALIPLASRGDDWVLGPGGRRLFVALPDVNQVAIVDTSTWKVSASVPGGIRPHRLAIQPDGRFLWVAGGVGRLDDSGVTVLDAADGRIAARIRTGSGRHDVALSDDSRHAFVTNAEAGTVSIIDTGTLRVVGEVTTGRSPASIAYSSQARLAYITDAKDGTISTIDPDSRRLVNRIQSAPGLGQIRFNPSGSVGFAVNPERNQLCVVDPTSNRIVQSIEVDKGPDQVTFSSEFAYVRHRGGSDVVMVSLKTAGREGVPLSLVRFPAGQGPAGTMSAPTPADSMVSAPGGGAMLVANPGDRSVYYYKEGLSAPMGTFNNYKREPRAVLVLDRGLRERGRPGVYETVARLDRPGKFDLIFFLDQPRIAHAFAFEVRPDPQLELARNRGKVDIQCLVAVAQLLVGQPFRPLFQINDRISGAPKAGLKDVELLMYRVGGDWQDRRVAEEILPGVYGADFSPDQQGVYDVFIACQSIGLTPKESRRLTLSVGEPASPAGPVAGPTTRPTQPTGGKPR